MFSFLKKRPDAKHLVGIGLCDEGIALACLSNEANSVQLSHIAYNKTDSFDDITQAITQWTKQHGLKESAVNFVLSTHQADLFLTEAPEVKDDELRQAMRWKVKDLIDYDLEDAVVDCFAIPGQRERGRQPMAYVVSAAVDVVKAYVSSIEESHLQINSIDISAMAQRNVASLLPEDKQGVAFLVLNQQHGLLSLTRDKALYLARDLDVGYGHFANNQQPGNDLPAQTQQTLDQIILEVQRSMDYYERYFAQPSIQSLVIAPLAKPIPGLIDYMAAQLGMQVRELDVNALLGLDNELERELQAMCLPAIGGALRVSSPSEQR